METEENKNFVARQKILTTKLHLPSPGASLVQRARLFKLLERGGEKKLVLVSAPAGYGKTSLVSEWIYDCGFQSCWISLDERDNDLRLFLTYFLTALQNIQGDIGKNVLMALQSQNPPETEQLLTELINEISGYSQFFLVVLDDYHTILEPQIQEALIFLLEHQPPQMTLVISSRSDPPWPLSRLRARDEILEIRTTDMRFNLTETTTYLNRFLNIRLSPKSISALYKRTEGWITGLQMAAISMRGRKDISSFIKSFTGSHRFVVDYLMEEVLEQQSEQIRDFLLKTSILDQLSGSICSEISGETGSQEILRYLTKANIFLTALDDSTSTFRYHKLFADLLQNKLRSIYPDMVPELHRRASHWYAQNGDPIEAIRYALKSGDVTFGMEQLERHVLLIIQLGEISTVRQWMSSIPEEVIRRHPILCIAQAWVSMKNANIEVVEELLSQAEILLSDTVSSKDQFALNVYQQVSSQITVLQAVIARVRGDPTEQQQKIVLEALDRIEGSGDTSAHATLFLRLGFCALDLGKDEKADQLFSQAFKLGGSSENHYAAQSANYARMVIARRHGQLDELAEICSQSLESLKGLRKKNRSLSGMALILQGMLLYDRNELKKADQHLTKGLKLIKNVGVPELLIKGWFTLACSQIAQGKDQPLPDLVKIAENASPALKFFAASLQAHLNLLLARNTSGTGELMEAYLWADGQNLALRRQASYDWEIYEKLVYARICCQQFRSSASHQNKDRLAEIFDFLTGQRFSLQELDWQGILIELDIVRALLLVSLDRELDAQAALGQALLPATLQKYVRPFLDEGEPMKELLRRSMTREAGGAYAQKLFLAFPARKGIHRSQAKMHSGEMVEPLSKREMQVLRFMDTDMSVPQIAVELVVADSTVRSHIKRIYSKLSVHSRHEATIKAKELGLL